MTCATPGCSSTTPSCTGATFERLAVDAVDERLAVVLAPGAARPWARRATFVERAAHDAAGGEGAAAQRAAGVRDLHVDGDGARGRIDRRADARDPAVEAPRRRRRSARPGRRAPRSPGARAPRRPARASSLRTIVNIGAPRATCSPVSTSRFSTTPLAGASDARVARLVAARAKRAPPRRRAARAPSPRPAARSCRSRSAIAPALNSDSVLLERSTAAFASSALRGHAVGLGARAAALLLARLEPREQLAGAPPARPRARTRPRGRPRAARARRSSRCGCRSPVRATPSSIVIGATVATSRRRERDRRRRTPAGATDRQLVHAPSLRRRPRGTARGTTLLSRAAAAGALAAGGRAGRILRAGGRQREQRESEWDGAERGRIRSHSTISEPTAASTSAGAGSAGRARARDRPKQGRGRTWREPRSSARSAARAAHRRPRAAW